MLEYSYWEIFVTAGAACGFISTLVFVAFLLDEVWLKARQRRHCRSLNMRVR